MKVLFAVNNDDISNAIVKKYQKNYREILSYKNVYYFNAILRELQKDKSYDRVVISEDLEPFANNNYDAIDKFLFEKLDNISDEAINNDGDDTDIIFICSDRRNKSDEMLSKLFSIGIYSAIIGQDRSTDEVCRLINIPRTKKEAKQYYRIETSAGYQTESENSVSETEVQNILAHYRRLGKNEDKYVESFNNIVSQYNDEQLKIIIRYLPIAVKAVLEERSEKYQQLISFAGQGTQVNTQSSTDKTTKSTGNKEEAIQVRMLENDTNKRNLTGPVVIPSEVNRAQVKKLIKETPRRPVEEPKVVKVEEMPNELVEEPNIVKVKEPELKGIDTLDIEKELSDVLDDETDDILEDETSSVVEDPKPVVEDPKPKRGRGRPRKNPPVEKQDENKPKRGRGRPRKNPLPEENKENEELVDLFSISDEDQSKQEVKESNEEELIDLFDLDETSEDNDNGANKEEDVNLFDLDESHSNSNSEPKNEEEAVDLFGLNEDELEEDEDEDIDFIQLEQSNNNAEKTDNNADLFNLNSENNNIRQNDYKNNEIENNTLQTQQRPIVNSNLATSLSKDKKIVSFVGTTKNGTSFIVNNAAQMLSSMGISTAILDMTKTRNAYYIYTNSNEALMKTAKDSIKKLKSGMADGIKVNKNLTVYTSLPEDESEITEIDRILDTLARNYSIILIDCDFDTPMDCFNLSQEVYLVQSMDVLTIQPLTAFLRNLQSKGILKQEKLKIVINKSVNIKSVSIKAIIGGISKYNDPSMTYMKDLFDKDSVPYCIIPFDVQNYTKYLDSLITCNVSLNGYSKLLMDSLKGLCNMIYPLINQKTYSPRGDKYKNEFSNEMNNTLNKMKRKYN